MKKLYLLVFTLLLLGEANAQFKMEGGLFVGVSSYQGDLVREDVPRLSQSNFAIGVMGRYNLNQILAVRGNFLFGKLSGDDLNYDDDVYRTRRALSFETSVTEISFLLDWEPLGVKRYQSSGHGFKKIVSPYAFVGLGLGFTNPMVDTSRSTRESLEEVILQDLNANFFKTRFVIPFGIGLKNDFSELWSVNFEIGMRYTFSDYIDGVSISGNPDGKDWYHFSGVTIIRRFGERIL